MEGREIAWRTLAQEQVDEPCIAQFLVMKGDYFSRLTGRDYWAGKDEVFLEALPLTGANLCPQYAMPQDRMGNAGEVGESWANRGGLREPEDVLPLIEALPDDEAVERSFDLAAAALAYAEPIRRHTDATHGALLFLDGFGQADFMGPYNTWGYVPYLSAIALYPEHLRRYYHYTATRARLQNLAIVDAVRRYGLAPFVYGGQDICDNAGPLAALATLDSIYFPELRRAVEPLTEAGIGIVWHCDGNVMPIVERLLEAGIAGLQGFQEEAGVPYERVVEWRSRSGKPLIIFGCVSVTTTLPFGSVEDVRRAVRRSFDLAGRGRGFVLAATSSIMPEVPDENIDAFFRYGREYGRRFMRGDR
ncbi:MAG: uroporphyrinogen decarboxylase family protein [Anaerolineae bacterium]